MKILLDMNLSPTWVPVLQEAGFEAIHWSSIGAANAADTQLFSWARDNEAIVFTHDLDFSALLAITGAEAPSVFQIRTHASVLRRWVLELLNYYNDLKIN